MEKLYCYVDETGQDTLGELFIVSIVITGDAREHLIRLCQEIEKESGKGRRKWHHAKRQYRLAYMQKILARKEFAGGLCYAAFHDTKTYEMVTANAIALAIQHNRKGAYKATILIDGLERSVERRYAKSLRQHGVSVRKVRGIAKEENHALSRLADALAGFVRNARFADDPDFRKLFENATKQGVIVELRTQKN